MPNTETQFTQILASCRQLFEKKLHDYGAAWRIMRPESLTDQIYIKANRIRSIQLQGKSKINEGIESEFVGIVNYGLIALIQLELGIEEGPITTTNEQALKYYDLKGKAVLDLMLAKNHDYGEAWRQMRVSSFVDLILSKVLRTKQIEDLGGETLVSEGVEANYMDMVNYAIFALIDLTL